MVCEDCRSRSSWVEEVVDYARKADDQIFFPPNFEMLRSSVSKTAGAL